MRETNRATDRISGRRAKGRPLCAKPVAKHGRRRMGYGANRAQGLTTDERRTLEACPRTNVMTIPGTCYLLPDEAPERVAEIIAEAVG
jgi:hypothetical protein